MAPLAIERVVSVNSEDPAFPAENLLRNTDSNKKWKCKIGEKQAIVVLQLKQPSVISGIDVGNAHSSFVEVLVGRSSSSNDNFQVLLVASALMTLKEAKDGTNVNGVRFFKTSDLLKPAANEKWDQVKIVCTQPFNKHVQYGLSFIVFHAPASSTSGDVSLGRFTLKKEEPDNDIGVGSWFAKRKEEKKEKLPLKGAAAIREASSPTGIALKKNKKTPTAFGNLINGLKKPEKKPEKDKKILKMMEMYEDQDDSDKDPDYEMGSGASEDEEEMFLPSFDVDDDNENRKKKRTTDENKPNTSKTPISTKPSTSQSPATPKANNSIKRNSENSGSRNKPKRLKVDDSKPKVTKPFNRLMEDVVLVISGYQNPLRGELRSKSFSMGSKYKADWDNTCTHLVCAFPNTPKFNQVRGRGKIVKKEWIEDCHDQRKRLPWRRYALDRNDQGKSESEEEIYEESLVTGNGSIERGDRRRTVSGDSDGSDTEEEIERVKARQKKFKVGTDLQPAQSPRKQKPEPDPYNEDTDLEEDLDSNRNDYSKQSKTTAALPLPPLLDMFDNIRFYISDDLGEEEIKRLRRYIIAYKGTILDILSTQVKYFITNKKELADKVKKDFRVTAVKPEWIWESNDEQRLLPSIPFEL